MRQLHISWHKIKLDQWKYTPFNIVSIKWNTAYAALNRDIWYSVEEIVCPACHITFTRRHYIINLLFPRNF